VVKIKLSELRGIIREIIKEESDVILEYNIKDKGVDNYLDIALSHAEKLGEFDVDDFDEKSRKTAERDLRAFFEKAEELLGRSSTWPEDFYLARNPHLKGWKPFKTNKNADELDAIAKDFGTCSVKSNRSDGVSLTCG